MFGPCQLIVDPATVFVVAYRTQRNNPASLHCPIPLHRSLYGGTFLAQCLHLNPPSMLNGLALSAGARFTLGD
jgi:hypothetical protein